MSDLEMMVPFKVKRVLHDYNGSVHYFFENCSGWWSYHCGDLNPKWSVTDPIWAKAAIRRSGKEINWLEILLICGTSKISAEQLLYSRG
jgi:hypothetical protein